MGFDKNALKAGVFILVALAMGIGVFIGVRGTSGLLGSQQTRLIVFELTDDVGGLTPGNDVRVGGLKIGRVTSVGLSEDQEQVHVVASIPQDVILREGAEVGVQTTVTGVAWLNFKDLGDGEPLPPDFAIEGTPGSFSTLIDAANNLAPTVVRVAEMVRDDTVPKVNRVLDNTDRLSTNLDGTREKLDDVITTVHEQVEPAAEKYHELADATIEAAGTAKATSESIKLTADRAASVAGHLDDVLAPDDNGEGGKTDLRQTLANVRQASAKLDAALADSGKAIASVREQLSRTEKILEDVKSITGDTTETARQVRGIVGGNRTRIDQIIGSLRNTGRTLELAASEIRRSPWRLLYRPDEGERRGLDLYDAARRFADGADAISDTAALLRDAADDPTADQERVNELLQQLETQLEQFDTVSRQLYQRVGE